MFQLTKNDFINSGRCNYEDEFHNKAVLTRKNNGFIAKLRFANTNVHTDAFEVKVPPSPGEGGQKMTLKFTDGIDHSLDTDVSGAICSFTALTQKWIDMLYGINLLDMSCDVVKKINQDENLTEADIWQQKMSVLSQFEELTSFVKSVFV